MLIDINIGDSYLIRTPPKNSHHFIAVMQLANGKHLFFCTTRHNSDLSCVINPWDEGVPPFITQQSTIAYNRPKEMNPRDLMALLDPSSDIPNGQFSQEQVDKIIAGGVKSKSLQYKYKQLFIDYQDRLFW